jgi:two-component system, LytTR family, sensor kinase
MESTRNKLITRITAFWILQTVGWTGYALDRYLSSEYFFPGVFIYVVVACGLSFALRQIYKILWSRSRSVLVIGSVAVFCSVLAGFIWLVISQFIFWFFKLNPYPDNSVLPYLKRTFMSTLIHHKPFLFLSWSGLYFGFKYWQDSRQREEQAFRAAALAREAELKMLRYQLNPHFLFNSLNSVSALIREDPERAEQTISELSDFLRYSLINTKVSDVPLKKELEAIRSYLDIERIRFEEKLDIRFDVESSAESFSVPSFLLHPLVENAIKFGMQTSPLPLTIEVTATSSNGSLHLEVVNTGRWKEPEKVYQSQLSNGASIGLENVRQRLEHAFSGNFSFDIFERDSRVHAVVDIHNTNKDDEKATDSSNR